MATKATLVKRVSVYLVFVIIGIVLTILYFSLKLDSAFQFQKIAWTDIPNQTATDMISDYQKEQEGIWPHNFRLRTGKGAILRGFWIDLNMLKAIDDSVKKYYPASNINGYSILFGKKKGTDKRYYSLVVRATEFKTTPNGNKLTSDTTAIGKYFDMVDPCPDNCGQQ